MPTTLFGCFLNVWTCSVHHFHYLQRWNSPDDTFTTFLNAWKHLFWVDVSSRRTGSALPRPACHSANSFPIFSHAAPFALLCACLNLGQDSQPSSPWLLIFRQNAVEWKWMRRCRCLAFSPLAAAFSHETQLYLPHQDVSFVPFAVCVLKQTRLFMQNRLLQHKVMQHKHWGHATDGVQFSCNWGNLKEGFKPELQLTWS